MFIHLFIKLFIEIKKTQKAIFKHISYGMCFFIYFVFTFSL